jgi:hypothetical protein
MTEEIGRRLRRNRFGVGRCVLSPVVRPAHGTEYDAGCLRQWFSRRSENDSLGKARFGRARRLSSGRARSDRAVYLYLRRLGIAQFPLIEKCRDPVDSCRTISLRYDHLPWIGCKLLGNRARKQGKQKVNRAPSGVGSIALIAVCMLF